MSQEINKPAERTYFTAHGPGNVVHRGVTEPNQVTTTGQPSLIADPDANEFATQFQQAALLIDSLPDLPPAPEGTNRGEWLEQDDLYNWEGRVLIVVQSHNRTQFSPDQTPALFAFARTTQEWEVGVQYGVDDEVAYEGTTYVCIQAHTSLVGWEPPNVPALWSPL